MDVVLINPQIPQNTGSIARTCAATHTPLHLVGKLGFDISEKAVRRAGLDYWPHVELYQHQNWSAYYNQHKPANVWLLSKFGRKIYYAAEFGPKDALVFGCETKGLGQEFLELFPSDNILQIPINCPAIRSLNLSNAVAIVLYESRRQLCLTRGPSPEHSLASSCS